MVCARDGKVWSGGLVMPAAFEGAATLLEAQRRHFLAMHAADSVVSILPARLSDGMQMIYQ